MHKHVVWLTELVHSQNCCDDDIEKIEHSCSHDFNHKSHKSYSLSQYNLSNIIKVPKVCAQTITFSVFTNKKTIFEPTDNNINYSLPLPFWSLTTKEFLSIISTFIL